MSKGAAAKHLWSLCSTPTKPPLGGGSNILSEEEDLAKTSSPRRIRVPILFFSIFLLSSFLCSQLMRDHIDQPKARKAHQAGKTQGDGIYDRTMPIIILAFRAFVFREVGNR